MQSSKADYDAKQKRRRPGGIVSAGRAVLFGLVFIILPSCMSVPPCCDDPLVFHEDVPFIPSQNSDCGPTALAMLLRYHGCFTTPDQIEQEIGSEHVRGTLTTDIEWIAREKGFDPDVRSGTIAELGQELELGRVALVLIDQGVLQIQNDHYMLVVGLCRNGIIAHTGKDKNRCIPTARFQKQWKRNNGWMMTLNTAGVSP